MDIAQLGIRIDSDDAKSGAKDLDDLSSAAHRAEAATEALRKTSDGAARGQKAASVERQKAIALAKQHAQAIQQSAAASARDAVTLQQMEAAAQQAQQAKSQLRDIADQLSTAERKEAGIRKILEQATRESTSATKAYKDALKAQVAAARDAEIAAQKEAAAIEAATIEKQKAAALAASAKKIKSDANRILQESAAYSQNAKSLQELEVAAEQAQQAKMALRDMSESVTAAERREAGMREILESATQQSTAATRAYTTALHAQNAASRQAAMRMQQMVYQSNDIIVSLLSGQAAHTVAMQQGGQLAQVYGGQGGVAQAFRDVSKLAGSIVSRLWPVAVAVGVVAVATAGLTAAINENSDVSVTMGDTLKASVLVAWDAITTMLAPAIQALGPYMEDAWEIAKTATAEFVNFSVRLTLSSFEEIKRVTKIGAVAVAGSIEVTFVALQNAIQASVNLAINGVNLLIEAFNKVNIGMEDIAIIDELLLTEKTAQDVLSSVADQIHAIQAESVENQKQIWSTDYAQQYFDAVKARSQEIARQRIEDEADVSKAEEEAARAREEAFNRIQSISDAAYQARLRQEGNIIDLINYRRDQEIAALTEAAEKAVANGAVYEEVYEAVAAAYVNIISNAEDEVQAYKDEKRAEEIRKAEEHARRLVRVEMDARRFDIDMQIGAANDNASSVSIWHGSGVSNFDPSIAQEQIRLEQQAKLQVLSEMEAERLALIKNNEEERLRVQGEFAARRDAVEEESLRRQADLQTQIAAAAMQNAEAIFSSLTEAAASAFGEQSGIFKAALIAEKTVAIARAIMGIQAGMAQALSLPFPANLAAYAEVAALGASILANLKSVSTAVAGKREHGGPVSAGMMYEVNERNKPEMFESGGRRYVMPGQNGKVTPFERMSANDNGSSQDRTPTEVLLRLSPELLATIAKQGEAIVRVERTATEAPGRAVAAVADDIRKGGGSVSGAMEQTYGNNRGVGGW